MDVISAADILSRAGGSRKLAEEAPFKSCSRWISKILERQFRRHEGDERGMKNGLTPGCDVFVREFRVEIILVVARKRRWV